MEKAIILVSFGVADAAQRRMCLDSIVEAAKERFFDWQIFQAYTSSFIRKQLAEENIAIPSLTDCLAELLADGYETIAVQPLHLTPGEEYVEKIEKPVRELQTKHQGILLGKPVFVSEDDDRMGLGAACAALTPQAEEELVFMGHGSPHHHNPVFERLQALADKEGLPVEIGVLERDDTPTLAEVIRRLQQKHKHNILLRPLLLSGGKHVREDMLGAGSDSWLSRLQQAGFNVAYDESGLGSFAVFRELYMRKLGQLIGSI